MTTFFAAFLVWTVFAFGTAFELDDVDVPTEGMCNNVEVSVKVSFLFLDSLMASGAGCTASDGSSLTGEKMPVDGGETDFPRIDGDLDFKRHLDFAAAVF